MSAEINIESMKEKAKASDYNETYHIIEQNGDFRIGTGVRMKEPEESDFFIEVVIILCDDGEDVDLSILKDKIDVIDELMDSGYEAKCDDDNSITCEKKIKGSNFEDEFLGLKKILKNLDKKEEKNEK